MPLPSHLFASDSDGALWDTRAPDWSHGRPVRARYMGARSSHRLDLQDVKAALRAGAHAWPGGYPLYFLTRDGAALSFEGARDAWREIVREFMDDTSTGWRVEGVDVNWEDGALTCDHTGKRIPSAYAEEDAA